MRLQEMHGGSLIVRINGQWRRQRPRLAFEGSCQYQPGPPRQHRLNCAQTVKDKDRERTHHQAALHDEGKIVGGQPRDDHRAERGGRDGGADRRPSRC